MLCPNDYEEKQIITHFDLLATDLLVQPSNLLASPTSTAHCWLCLAHQDPQIIFSNIPINQILAYESLACTNAGAGSVLVQDFVFCYCWIPEVLVGWLLQPDAAPKHINWPFQFCAISIPDKIVPMNPSSSLKKMLNRLGPRRDLWRSLLLMKLKVLCGPLTATRGVWWAMQLLTDLSFHPSKLYCSNSSKRMLSQITSKPSWSQDQKSAILLSLPDSVISPQMSERWLGMISP